MFARIHEKLGTAGFVISIVALIAALSGGAYAAGALSPQVKKQITKESKKFSKKFSKQFAVPGPAGPAGPAGSAGSKGDKGDQGIQGNQGIQGIQGNEGSPWTVGGVLPEGETETGAWSFGITANNKAQEVSVSFNIPLETAPTIHFIKPNGLEKVVNQTTFEIEEVSQPDCPGTAAEPSAEPGSLCLYVASETGVNFGNYPNPTFTQSYPTGAVIGVLLSATEARAYGTWAVTAP